MVFYTQQQDPSQINELSIKSGIFIKKTKAVFPLTTKAFTIKESLLGRREQWYQVSLLNMNIVLWLKKKCIWIIFLCLIPLVSIVVVFAQQDKNSKQQTSAELYIVSAIRWRDSSSLLRRFSINFYTPSQLVNDKVRVIIFHICKTDFFFFMKNNWLASIRKSNKKHFHKQKNDY